jgi:maleate isomerase
LRSCAPIAARHHAAMTPPAIGTILPSSNRVVERTTAALLRHLPGVDSCAARIPYAPDGSGQPEGAYDAASYATAARLLGHAGVAAVCWNGTRGAALGLAADRALVTMLSAEAGCPATTTALFAAEWLRRRGARRIALLLPGQVADAAGHAAGFAAEGLATCGARGLGCPDNLAAAAVPPETIAAAARALAAEAAPDALLIWSTNLPGLHTMAPLEAELGLPVLDSAALGIAAVLEASGIDTAPLARFGRVFAAP